MNIKISGIKNFFSNIIWNAVRHFTFSVVILFLIAVLIGGIVFYKYVFLAQKQGEKNAGSFLSIKESNYQGVLKSWQDQEQKFNEADLKEYPDPFKKPIPTKLPKK